MSASRTTRKELLGLLARIAAGCELANSCGLENGPPKGWASPSAIALYGLMLGGDENLYDEIIETLEEAESI